VHDEAVATHTCGVSRVAPLELLASVGPLNAAVAAGCECAELRIEIEGAVDVHVENPFYALSSSSSSAAATSSNNISTGDSSSFRHLTTMTLKTKVLATGNVSLYAPGHGLNTPVLECTSGIRCGVSVVYPIAWNGHVRSNTHLTLSEPQINLLFDVTQSFADFGADWSAASSLSPFEVPWYSQRFASDLVDSAALFQPSSTSFSAEAVGETTLRMNANTGNVIDAPWEPTANAHAVFSIPSVRYSQTM